MASQLPDPDAPPTNPPTDRPNAASLWSAVLLFDGGNRLPPVTAVA
jgi:hypothetical protein